MEEKDIIKNLFTDLYDLQKRYFYIPLSDFLWEHLAREMEEIRDKYKIHGESIDRLCRDMIGALTAYKERKEGRKC